MATSQRWNKKEYVNDLPFLPALNTIMHISNSEKGREQGCSSALIGKQERRQTNGLYAAYILYYYYQIENPSTPKEDGTDLLVTFLHPSMKNKANSLFLSPSLHFINVNMFLFLSKISLPWYFLSFFIKRILVTWSLNETC